MRLSKPGPQTHDGFALFRGGQEFAAPGTTGKRLAATDCRILELLGEVEFFQRAVGSNALALGFEAQAAVGLFVAENTDLADGVLHGVTAHQSTP